MEDMFSTFLLGITVCVVSALLALLIGCFYRYFVITCIIFIGIFCVYSIGVASRIILGV